MNHITVPVSTDAMQRLDINECIDGDLVDMILSDEERDFLWKTNILQKINAQTNSLIDDYEDESITDLNHLFKCRKIVADYLLYRNGDIIVQKLYHLINTAIGCKTGIFFFF